MDLSEYAAVAFAGANADEYIFFGKGSLAAGKVIQRMQQAGKPVAAICLGQAALAGHGTLKGKRVAECELLKRKHPFLTGKDSGITWDGPGVTVDGKLITATGGRESVQFADAIIEAIRGK
jgi:putative intracellular protease/amidase